MFDFSVIVHIKTEFYQDLPESHPTPCHTQKSAKYFDYGLQHKFAMKRIFTWRVSDCEELVGVTHRG